MKTKQVIRYYNPFSYMLGKNPHHALYASKPTMIHRGVAVYQKCHHHYVFIVDGVCVTERVACSKSAIDAMLDGDPCQFEAERYREALRIGKEQLANSNG